MKKLDNQAISTGVLAAVGGSDNIVLANHCATRLRLTIKDTDKVEEEKLKAVPGVLGLAKNLNEYQVIIGPGVESLYLEFIKQSGLEQQTAVDDPATAHMTKQKKGWFFTFTDFIAGAIMPALPVIVAGGMINAILVLLTTFCGLDDTSGTYTVLHAIYTGAFSFMPVYIGYNAAKKVGVTPMLGALLGGVMVCGDISGIEGLTFLGIPITTPGYTSTILPVILGVVFMQLVYKPVDRIIPKEIKFFAVPILTMIVSVPVTLIALGPIAAWVGQMLGSFLVWLSNTIGGLAVGIMGAATPFLMYTGTGSGLYAPIFVSFEQLGYEAFVMPGMLAGNVAVGGAAIASWTLLKKTDNKAVAFSSGLTAVFGITEPAIFGVLGRFRKPFIGATVGGLAGGIFAGVTHVAEFAFASPGVASVIAFINPDGTMSNFWLAVVTMVISFAVAFAVTRILGLDEAGAVKE
ncbi:PTS system beta-glucoside-specific EIIBCA component [Lachnospiraceae bacterium]|nr:PTS transporter subunit EIIC [Lachnospiraceae bacterium]GFI10272.1 PTS system beta-glucoside-specific EIIBCA component [Lachnospiraceae bacterium]